MKTQTKWLLGAGAGAAALGVVYWLYRKAQDAAHVLVPGGVPADELPGGAPVGGATTLPGEPVSTLGPSGGERIYETPGTSVMPTSETPPTGGSVGPGSTTPGGDTTTTTGGGTGGGAEGNEPRKQTQREKAQEALAALKNLQLTLKRAGFSFVQVARIPLASMTTLTAQADKWGAYAFLRALPGSAVWTISGGVTPDNKIYFVAILKAYPAVKAALLFTPPAVALTPPTGTTLNVDGDSVAPADKQKAKAVEVVKTALKAMAGAGWLPVAKLSAGATGAPGPLGMAIVKEVTPLLTPDAEGAKAAGVTLETYAAADGSAAFVRVLVKGKQLLLFAKQFKAGAGAGSTTTGTTTTTTTTGGGAATTGGAGTASAAAIAAKQRQALLDSLAKGGWAVTSGSVAGYKAQLPSPLIVSLHTNLLKSAGLTVAKAAQLGLVIKYYADLSTKRLFAVAEVGGTKTMLRYVYPYTPDAPENGAQPSASTVTTPAGGSALAASGTVAAQQAMQQQITKALDKLRAAGLVPVRPADVPKSLKPIPYADSKKYYDMAQQVVGAGWKVEGFWNEQKTQIFIRFTGTGPVTSKLPQTWLKMVLGQRAAG